VLRGAASVKEVKAKMAETTVVVNFIVSVVFVYKCDSDISGKSPVYADA
jgi:hypothetical protein